MESGGFPTCSKDVPQGLEKFNGAREVFFNTFLKAPKCEEVDEKEEVVLDFGGLRGDPEKPTLQSCKELHSEEGGGVNCQ